MLPAALAMMQIQQTLSQVFVLTPKIGAVLGRIARFAAAGAYARYGDLNTFLNRCFDKEYENPPFAPLCITGPAGNSKSQISMAATKLIVDGQRVEVDGNYDPFVMRGFLRLQMQRGDVDSTLIARIAMELGVSCSLTGGGPGVERQCVKVGHRDAVAALLLDEFQHVTLSTANARITSMLFTARGIGIPVVFLFNFSLAHKLQARPQEDRDRLLRNVIVHSRETSDSEGWLLIVRGTLSVLGTYFLLDAVENAAELGRLSGCLPRNLHRLLELAYGVFRDSKGGRGVTIKHVQTAFHSRDFASARTDIRNLDAIANGDISAARAHPDLCCPEELLQDSEPQQLDTSDAHRDNEMAKHLLNASMTVGERMGQKRAEDENKMKSAPRKNVVPIHAKKPRTAKSLLDAHDDFE